MHDDEPVRDAPRFFGSGAKTAALIFILGAVAAFTDQAFFVKPRPAVSPVSAATTTAAAPAQQGAFVVPGQLRTDAGEVPAHVSTF